MKNAAFIRLAVLILSIANVVPTWGQSISGVINSYYRVTAINAATSQVTVSNAAGLTPGLKVLIIQMKGASIDGSNSSSFGNITSIGEAGTYEYNTICAVAGNDILLRNELTRPYNSSASVQLIPVPQYNIVTVTDTLKAAAWNRATGTGGVLVIEADTIYLNSGIDVSGQGFAGGDFVNFTTPTYDCSWAVNVMNYFLSLTPTPNQYYSGGHKGEGIAEFITNAEYGRGKQANGGGGGNNHNTGGAGGANYGSGGNGGVRSNEGAFLCHGTNPGIGGLSVSSQGYTVANNRIFLGGGGGSGHQNNAKGTPGGNGGGIVIVRANVLVGAGTTILADGATPVNLTNVDPYSAEGDGGGGGGAGGSVILDVTEVLGNIDVVARGGRGSDASRGTSDCLGPGGGGGGGVLWVKGGAALPNVATTLNGGSNGVISTLTTVVACRGQANGATSGTVGQALVDYVPPALGNFLCTPLAVPELKFFKGRYENKTNVLWWTMTSIDDVSSYELERSVDQVSFTGIGSVANNGKYSFSIIDARSSLGTTYYRLKIIRQNGSISYSSIVIITHHVSSVFNQVTVFPNPATHRLNLSIVTSKNASARIAVYNASGQRTFDRQIRLSAGYQTLSVPVSQYTPGIYLLTLDADGVSERKKFIKIN